MRELIAAIIPARYESTRLPGKPLLEIGGAPLIMHVVNRARLVSGIDRIIVATDDDRIRRVVEAAGAEAMMTSTAHRTGTDRLAEVAARIDAGIIVNIQGDEPLIEPATVEAAIAPLLADPTLEMSTTSEPIDSIDDLLSPHIVKVVTSLAGDALYFSRNPIPFPRAAVLAAGSLRAALEGSSCDAVKSLLAAYSRHTGLYVYRRDLLLRFSRWRSTPLEEAEALEQLRALEYGVRIRVVRVDHRSIGVDTAEDLARVRELIGTRH